MANGPDRQTIRSAVALATRAPSLHNSQPWRWRAAEHSLHLFADASRLLPATDPEGRDLLLSCGASLHHLQVALAAEGWASTVHRLPNPNRPDHLAAVEFHSKEPERRDVELAAAIPRRHTDRRGYSSWEVPVALLDELAIVASDQGSALVAATDATARFQLASAMAKAALRQEADSEYAAELATWTGRSPFVVEGVPATVIPASGRRHEDTTMRAFPNGLLTEPAGEESDAGALLVLATARDDVVWRLRAGEAMSAVLLAATDFRLATCPLSQVFELPDTRTLVRDRVLGGFGYPQVVLRVGWAPVRSAPLPATPRRPLDEVFGSFEC
ncbi:NAD(P)H nitroreductase [Kutzneria viridogrisea]|uniref:Nitroreductase n=2 Tax=Kutzneria TaxID=43356 RepID=A0ABR6BZK4_9PSEU|nr:NAD(P)H nitroreductase [Kutzneria albida]AHH97002.1 putative NAD(P)H nitroreductase [Kutzneria albida DSM 43870]MBA8932032.1 nitroreductase [Kutzneria viridogrisea]